MSLCASYFAVPLVAVRLNYKSVTKLCVFHDHFNQSNFHFCDNTMILFISDELFSCVTFPKYTLCISCAIFKYLGCTTAARGLCNKIQLAAVSVCYIVCGDM